MEHKFYLTNDADIERLAYLFLRKIGADQSLSGTKYLIYIISNVVKNPSQIKTLCAPNGLYAVVAERFGVEKKASVERCVRHVCHKLHDELPTEEYCLLFGTEKKVTNKRMIEVACNYIRYESDKLCD